MTMSDGEDAGTDAGGPGLAWPGLSRLCARPCRRDGMDVRGRRRRALAGGTRSGSVGRLAGWLYIVLVGGRCRL
jgi:hypothetical protein